MVSYIGTATTTFSALYKYSYDLYCFSCPYELRANNSDWNDDAVIRLGSSFRAVIVSLFGSAGRVLFYYFYKQTQNGYIGADQRYRARDVSNSEK